MECRLASNVGGEEAEEPVRNLGRAGRVRGSKGIKTFG